MRTATPPEQNTSPSLLETQPLRVVPKLAPPKKSPRQGLLRTFRQVLAICFILLIRFVRAVRRVINAPRPGFYYVVIFLLLFAIVGVYALYHKYWQDEVKSIFQIGKRGVYLAAWASGGVLVRYFFLLDEPSRKQPGLSLFLCQVLGSVAAAAAIVPVIVFLLTSAQLNDIVPYPLTLHGASFGVLGVLAMILGFSSSKHLRQIMDRAAGRVAVLFKPAQPSVSRARRKNNEQK